MVQKHLKTRKFVVRARKFVVRARKFVVRHISEPASVKGSLSTEKGTIK